MWPFRKKIDAENQGDDFAEDEVAVVSEEEKPKEEEPYYHAQDD